MRVEICVKEAEATTTITVKTDVAAAREQCDYFYSLLKWTIAVSVALVGWLCLTDAEARPLLSPIWPAAIILEGSLALASAAIAVHEAALEAPRREAPIP